ncbi:MAG TPA: cytochrome c maturation protein CcmE [Thermoleophilia bacterium]|nr:cytochrome c maturation protein CcmE [Thermoleophilia bacterium]
MNKKARRRLIIATVVIVAAFTVGVVLLVSKQGAYYRQVSDLTVENLDGKNVKVGGKVVPGSIVHDQNGYRFAIVDLTGRESTVKVEYTGQMPETFGPNVDVVVTGPFAAATTTISAEQLQTKCPSKYEAQASGGQPSQPSQ